MRSAPAGAATQVLQRLVAPPGVTIQGWNAMDAQLGVIAAAVDNYNANAGAEVTAADFQASFANLQRVDRSIYRWFRLKSRIHQELRLIPHYQQVKGLLDSASIEHEALVDRTRHMAVLPFDAAGLDSNEVIAASALWQDIVQGARDIRILGSQAYQRRIRSELAKIMATPTGRQLLTYLNTPKPGVLQGTPNADLYRTFIGERVADLPQNVIAASPELLDQNRSESQPLNIDENTPGRKLQDITEAVQTDFDDSDSMESVDVPDITRQNLSRVRDVVLSGGTGYIHGSKKYQFSNPGTGSFVTSFPGLSLMGGRSAGNQIFDPSWLTLGHELGHSANMKAGATQVGHKAAVDDEFLAGLAGGTEPAKKWTNAEELLNIKNIENALCEESGLSPRVGHQPPQWAQTIAIQVRLALRAPLYVLSGMDPAWFSHPDWSRLEQKFRTLPMISCHDPVELQARQAERDAFLNLWTVGPVNAPTGGNAAFQRWKVVKGL